MNTYKTGNFRGLEVRLKNYCDYLYSSIGGNMRRWIVLLHPFMLTVTKGQEVRSINPEDKIQWL